MCIESRLKYFLIDLIYSALFFPASPAFLLARSPDDPQRIRVASVFEFSVVSLSACFWANFLIFQRSRAGPQSRPLPLVSFLILVRSQPDLLIKHILIKKNECNSNLGSQVIQSHYQVYPLVSAAY